MITGISNIGKEREEILNNLLCKIDLLQSIPSGDVTQRVGMIGEIGQMNVN